MLSAAVTALFVVLSGCANVGMNGSGPITLSSGCTALYEKYRGHSNEWAMAVSPEGSCSVGYCKAVYDGCGGSSKKTARQSCDKRSDTDSPCMVFSDRDRVVWDGPVTFQ